MIIKTIVHFRKELVQYEEFGPNLRFLRVYAYCPESDNNFMVITTELNRDKPDINGGYMMVFDTSKSYEYRINKDGKQVSASYTIDQICKFNEQYDELLRKNSNPPLPY